MCVTNFVLCDFLNILGRCARFFWRERSDHQMRSKSLALMMQQSRSLRGWPLATNCTNREGYAPGQWGGTSTERVMTSSPRITSPLLAETYHTRHGMRSCDAVNRSATWRSSDRASCFSLFIVAIYMIDVIVTVELSFLRDFLFL